MRSISNYLTGSFLFYFSLIVLGQGGSMTGYAEEQIKFSLHRGYGIVLPVQANDLGPVKFLLDTGANTTILTPEFARRLRLLAIDRTELITPAGRQIVVRSQLQRLGVGASAIENLEVLFSDLAEVRRLDPEICGVLGQNFLSNFNFLIDYQDRRIEFETQDEIERGVQGVSVPLEINDGRPIVSVRRERGNCKAARLLLDSGTPALILFRRKPIIDALQIVTIEQAGSELRTDFGSRSITQGVVRSLRIGDQKLINVKIALADGVGDGRPEDGLLPAALFSRLYFNHRKGYVTLNPGRKRDYETNEINETNEIKIEKRIKPS